MFFSEPVNNFKQSCSISSGIFGKMGFNFVKIDGHIYYLNKRGLLLNDFDFDF